MGTISPPERVKPIFGFLFKNNSHWLDVLSFISSHFSPVDYISEEFPFVETDYYQEEMGEGLLRRYLSAKNLVYPDFLVHMKHLCNLWEAQNSVDGKRQVNLDPGYLTPAKLVLASTKNFYHRIYIGRGIYAEVTMHYTQGDFQKLKWTYPDYYNHREYFLCLRNAYKQQLKAIALTSEENE